MLERVRDARERERDPERENFSHFQVNVMNCFRCVTKLALSPFCSFIASSRDSIKNFF